MGVSDRAWMWIIICATIVSGGIASLSAKTLFQISTADICDGAQPLFTKPYFLTVVRTRPYTTAQHNSAPASTSVVSAAHRLFDPIRAAAVQAMFIGEACCLPIYHLVVKRNQQRPAVAPQSTTNHYNTPLLDDDTPLPTSTTPHPNPHPPHPQPPTAPRCPPARRGSSSCCARSI